MEKKENKGGRNPASKKVSAIFYRLAVTRTNRRGHHREQQPEEITMRRRWKGMKNTERDSWFKNENDEM